MPLFEQHPELIEHKGARVYIGPAGWSYKDWAGRVYPKPEPSDFRRPTYLAQFFNTIELNNTFYRPPRADYCARWVRDVEENPNFLFTAKLWKRFTHEREEPWNASDVATFRGGIEPLVEAERLGALLVQFPWSFHYHDENCEWLQGVVAEFEDLPLVVEMRGKEWIGDQALDFLRSLEAGFCNVDQPAYKSNIPLTRYAFGSLGYLRLHGRNYEAWFDDDAGRDERYDYLYEKEELDELAAAIDDIAEQVERMFVIANNHYGGQAVATSTQLTERLTGEHAEAPGRIREIYGI